MFTVHSDYHCAGNAWGTQVQGESGDPAKAVALAAKLARDCDEVMVIETDDHRRVLTTDGDEFYAGYWGPSLSRTEAVRRVRDGNDQDASISLEYVP